MTFRPLIPNSSPCLYVKEFGFSSRNCVRDPLNLGFETMYQTKRKFDGEILKSRTLYKLMILLSFALVMAGCGNTDVDFVSTNGLGVRSSEVLFGRTLLEAPASGALAELTDLSNRPLSYEAVEVDSSGNFRIPIEIGLLPEEFRVRITHPKTSPWDVPIIANVRNFTKGDSVYPNLLTTAAALYRERQGGTQDEAVSWVKTTFQIPKDVNIGYGIDESRRAPFKHSVFLLKAAENGGVSAFLSSIVDSPPVAERSFASEATGPSFGRRVGVSVVASIGLSIIDRVGGTLVGQIAQSLGLNTGDSSEIQMVGQQLVEIQNDLEALNQEIESDFNQLDKLAVTSSLLQIYVTGTESLQSDLAEIEVQTEDLLTEALDARITNAPFIPDSGVADLLSSISGYNGRTDLDVIATQLLGNSNSGQASLLEVYQKLLSESLGVAPIPPDGGTVVWARTPVLTNPRIFDAFERFLAFYTQQQTLALNLVAENANSSFDEATVSESKQTAGKFQVDQALQSQYLGAPLFSDKYLAFPGFAFGFPFYGPAPSSPSGTIFYSDIQDTALAYTNFSEQQVQEPGAFYVILSSDGGQNFIQQTQTFKGPGYPSDNPTKFDPSVDDASQGWRLPTLPELEQLRTLALGVNPSDATAGLLSLGFQAPDDWDGTLWYLDYTEPNVRGFADSNRVEINEFDPVKAYVFSTGDKLGYTAPEALNDLYQNPRCYMQVHYQSFSEDQGYERIVAAGFRPTEAPELALSSDGSQVIASFNGQDISRFCVWSSSNPGRLEVRGLGSDAGKLIWHLTDSTPIIPSPTVTASWQGMNPSNGEAVNLSTSLEVPVPDPPPVRNLTSILINPSNLILLDASANQSFVAMGYYDDGSVEDLTDQAIWSLELPDGSAYPPGEAEISNGATPGILVFNPTNQTPFFILDPLLTLKATQGNVVGQTQVEVATPF